MKKIEKKEKITISEYFHVDVTNNFNGESSLTLFNRNGFLLFQVRMNTKVFQDSDKLNIARMMLEDYHDSI